MPTPTKRERIDRDEVGRLHELLTKREAAVADAKSKLKAAEERAKP